MLFNDSVSENGKHSFQHSTWTSEEDPNDRFSAVSLSAVFALIGGILSLFCLVNHSLWPIPAVTLAVTLWSFWRISRAEGRLAGTGMARLALALALVPLTAAPIQNFLYCRQLTNQARAFFPLVIEAAQKGDTAALNQFLRYQTSRETITNEADFWKRQFADPMGGMSVSLLVRNPFLVTMANLGENASVTYDHTAQIAHDSKHDTDQICCIYAVTYSEHGAKKTFFIPLYGMRVRDKNHRTALWKCERYASKPIAVSGTPQ